MSLLEINAEEAQKKLTVVNRFPFQIISLFFGIAIVYLFTAQKGLETEFRTYMKEQGKETTVELSKNTDVLKEIKSVLLDNQTILKQTNKQTKP